MELRLIVAYSLIALMALLAVGFAAYRVYYARERVYRRRLRREELIHETRQR